MKPTAAWGDTDALAAYLSMSPDWVRDKVERGLLTCYHLGRTRFFNLKEARAAVGHMVGEAEPERQPTRTISGQWLIDQRQPFVYVWRRGDRVLYVGSAGKGMTRLLGAHDHLTPNAVLPDDVIELYHRTTAASAVELEDALIHELNPELNRWKTRRA